MKYQLNYQIMREINYGSEEYPDIQRKFYDASLFATDENYDAQMAFAQAEAYNGEVTVEALGEEDPPDGGDIEARVAALETAVAGGLNLYEEDLGNG